MRVRRFFCDEIACARRTFAEQVPGLTTPYARRTPLLRGILEKVALALGGRPGSRMSRLLAVGSSLTLSGPGFSPRRRPRNDGIHGSPPRHLGGHPARRYNYWLGGKDNFAADRESGDEIAEFFPTIRVMAVENRRLLRRAVGYLAEEAGIRQFLDIGTGLPTADNTHEVAQRIAPESRILYVDNDPLVLVHARALLTSSPEGRTDYVNADLNDPQAILRRPALRETLDLGEPVALVLLAVLHFITDRTRAAEFVHELMAALPPGSYLLASHATQDFETPEAIATYRTMLDQGRSDVWPATRADMAAVFDGFTLIEPGIVPAGEWRPAAGTEIPDPKSVGLYAGVARKD